MYEKTFWESFLKIFWGLYRDSVGLQPPKMGWYILRVYSSFDYWKMGFDCQLYHLLAHWAQVTFLLSLNLNCLIRKRTIKCLTALLERLSITPKSTYLLCLLHGLKVQFSRSVMSDSLRPHGLQHARPPCPLPTPRACSNSCPLSQRCHPTISSSVVPFSSCFQSFPAW